MKERDAAGRTIDPFGLFRRATKRGLAATEEYCEATSPASRVSVIRTDARYLDNRLRRQVDAIITSPPYYNAVDYFRRHKLEMFWLGLTRTQEERLGLLPRYIGRRRVSIKDATLARLDELGPLSMSWYERMRKVSRDRANAFAHYVLSMKDVMDQLAAVVRSGGPLILVLGDSDWNGSKIPTSELFVEIAGGSFHLTDRLWYPVQNRYMSYGRRNGADINQEHVLVFAKATTNR